MITDSQNLWREKATDMKGREELVENYKCYLETLPQWKNLALNTFAQSSLKSFLDIGLPDKTREDWKFTNPRKNMLTKILRPKKNEYAHDLNNFVIHPESVLAIVDGNYSEELSTIPPGISLSVYSPSTTHLHQSYLKGLKSQHIDSFDALNGALANEMLFLILEEECHLKTPLTILHLNTSENVTLCPRLFIKACPSSEGHIVECFVSSIQEAYQTYAITNIHVENEAKITHIKIQNQNSSSLHYGKVEVSLSKNSFLSSLTLSIGANFSRNNIHVYLDQENARSQVDGIFILNDNDQCDNFSAIHHNSPYTYNNQLFKGVLQGTSRGIFTGKICIPKDSQKVESSQLSQNLLLSQKAQLITRPQLEIYADDVKCNHGATMGEINSDEVFYLKTRGIPENTAKEMLILGILLDVVERQESTLIKHYLQSLLRKLGSKCYAA